MGAMDIAHYGVRGWQWVLALIVMAISANIIAHVHHTDGKAGFNVFAGVWTLLIMPGLFFFGRKAHGGILFMSLLGFEILSAIIWVAAWASMADYVSTARAYGLSGRAKAAAVLGALVWLGILFTLAHLLVDFFRDRKGRTGRVGGTTTTTPATAGPHSGLDATPKPDYA